MLRDKRCPRCKGYVMLDRDIHGWYEQCLQCGYQRDLEIMDDMNPVVGVEKGGEKDVRGKKV